MSKFLQFILSRLQGIFEQNDFERQGRRRRARGGFRRYTPAQQARMAYNTATRLLKRKANAVRRHIVYVRRNEDDFQELVDRENQAFLGLEPHFPEEQRTNEITEILNFHVDIYNTYCRAILDELYELILKTITHQSKAPLSCVII